MNKFYLKIEKCHLCAIPDFTGIEQFNENSIREKYCSEATQNLGELKWNIQMLHARREQNKDKPFSKNVYICKFNEKAKPTSSQSHKSILSH